jgi:hypothetical protein
LAVGTAFGSFGGDRHRGAVDGRIVGLHLVAQFDVFDVVFIHLPAGGGEFIAGEVDVDNLNVAGADPVRGRRAGQQRHIAGTQLLVNPSAVDAAAHRRCATVVGDDHEVPHRRDLDVRAAVPVAAHRKTLPRFRAVHGELTRHPSRELLRHDQSGGHRAIPRPGGSATA